MSIREFSPGLLESWNTIKKATSYILFETSIPLDSAEQYNFLVQSCHKVIPAFDKVIAQISGTKEFVDNMFWFMGRQVTILGVLTGSLFVGFTLFAVGDYREAQAKSRQSHQQKKEPQQKKELQQKELQLQPSYLKCLGSVLTFSSIAGVALCALSQKNFIEQMHGNWLAQKAVLSL